MEDCIAYMFFTFFSFFNFTFYFHDIGFGEEKES